MPRYEGLQDWTAARIDEEGLEVFRGNVRGRAVANQEAYNEARRGHETMIALSRKTWGANHQTTKYLAGKQVPRPPNLAAEQMRLEANYKALLTRRETKERRRLAAEARALERDRILAERRAKQADYFKRRKTAITILIMMGYKPDEDFKPTRAISFLKRKGGAVNEPLQLADGKG